MKYFPQISGKSSILPKQPGNRKPLELGPNIARKKT